MNTKKVAEREDPLDQLIKAADPEILGKLIKELALTKPEIRRECFEFLKDHVTLTPDEKSVSSAEAMFALWMELEPDLAELDEYGGGDYGVEEHVGSLLYELSDKLGKESIPSESRKALLDEVLAYIKSGNAGMDDALYDVAFAGCHDTDDLRDLAQRFESIGRDWPIGNARRIYRDIGDHDKYLELRLLKMEFGGDYYDLATFYWETGDKDKALKIAEKGLTKGKGRMVELRSFMMERAKESRDRSGYLKLRFMQATDSLTLKEYKAFKKICKDKEWSDYEPKILKKLKNAWSVERIKIHIFRNEYDQAIKLLTRSRYPSISYGGSEIIKIAKQLAPKYPKEIVSFYRSGLGNLNSSTDRKTYANQAQVMLKVRHMWVDVMKTPEKWEIYGRKVKTMNSKRPAFQEEFAKAIPGWKDL